MSSAAPPNMEDNPRKRHEDPSAPGNTNKKPRRRRNNNSNSNGVSNNDGNRNRNRNRNSKGNNNLDGNKTQTMDVETTAATSVKTNNNHQEKNRHQFSDLKFVSVDAISANSKRALTEVLQYEYMTKVQEATLPSILEGQDIVAKGK